MKFTKILESNFYWLINLLAVIRVSLAFLLFSILGEKIDQAEFISYQDSFNAFDSNNNGRISHKSLQVSKFN